MMSWTPKTLSLEVSRTKIKIERFGNLLREPIQVDKNSQSFMYFGSVVHDPGVLDQDQEMLVSGAERPSYVF